MMNDEGLTVFTIGHSTHNWEDFLNLLNIHAVTALADVRSSPYSRHNPQYNRQTLEQELNMNGIKYVFLGRELGARSEDISCYEKGRIVFDRLAATQLFKIGIERIIHGSLRYRIAIMCSEKEPLECHRTLLVSRVLAARGIGVNHILADGSLETQDEAMERLLKIVGIPKVDLFKTKEELINEAVAIQEKQVAYVDQSLVANI